MTIAGTAALTNLYQLVPLFTHCARTVTEQTKGRHCYILSMGVHTLP